MIRTLISASLLLVFAALHASADDWERYEGAWFAADAPAGFRAQVAANATADDGPMTVRFIAPDGDVAFFIHAPLWSTPTSETDGAEGETLLGERTAKTGRT